MKHLFFPLQLEFRRSFCAIICALLFTGGCTALMVKECPQVNRTGDCFFIDGLVFPFERPDIGKLEIWESSSGDSWRQLKFCGLEKRYEFLNPRRAYKVGNTYYAKLRKKRQGTQVFWMLKRSGTKETHFDSKRLGVMPDLFLQPAGNERWFRKDPKMMGSIVQRAMIVWVKSGTEWTKTHKGYFTGFDFRPQETYLLWVQKKSGFVAIHGIAPSAEALRGAPEKPSGLSPQAVLAKEFLSTLTGANPSLGLISTEKLEVRVWCPYLKLWEDNRGLRTLGKFSLLREGCVQVLKPNREMWVYKLRDNVTRKPGYVAIGKHMFHIGTRTAEVDGAPCMRIK